MESIDAEKFTVEIKMPLKAKAEGLSSGMKLSISVVISKNPTAPGTSFSCSNVSVIAFLILMKIRKTDLDSGYSHSHFGFAKIMFLGMKQQKTKEHKTFGKSHMKW